MKDAQRYDHPSYGIITISRMTSNKKRSFYGSSMKHNQSICIQIRKSYKERALNHDWYMGGEPLIEIEMTPHQWAEFLSSMNIGDGVPCTIRCDRGNQYTCPDEPSQRELFQKEFDQEVQKSMDSIQSAIQLWSQLAAKKSLTKADKDQITNLLQNIQTTFRSNIPFVQKSFNETLDNTVHAAKSELEAWQDNMLHALGVKALGEQMAQADVMDSIPSACDESLLGNVNEKTEEQQ